MTINYRSKITLHKNGNKNKLENFLSRYERIMEGRDLKLSYFLKVS